MATQKQKDNLAKLKANCKHIDFYRYWYSEDHLMNVCRHCFHEWEEKHRPFFLEDHHNLDSGKFAKTESDGRNYDIYCKKYGIGEYKDTRSNKGDLIYMAKRNIRLKGDENTLSPLELITRGYIQGARDMQNLGYLEDYLNTKTVCFKQFVLNSFFLTVFFISVS